MKLKVYISQPMRNKTREEIENEREEAIESLKTHFGKEIEIIDSKLNKLPKIKNPRVWGLGRAITKLAEADIAYFCKGWNESKGCIIERSIADEYGIETYEVLEDD